MTVPDSMFPGCQKAADWVDWPADVTKLIVEPKLDGYRLSVVVDAEGRVSFHCGKAEQPGWAENLGHIAQAVRATGIREVMLDGEVMADTWNQTSSLLRRKRSKMDDAKKEQIRREVRFHAFDAIPLDIAREMRKLPRRRKEIEVVPVPLFERRALLEQILERAPCSVLRPVPQFEVFSLLQLHERFDELIDLEYEGAMAKVIDAPYAFDRVDFWQKLKPWRTIELTVTGAIEGKGKHKGRLGALEGVTVEGQSANCGGGFTDEVREKLWYTWLTRPQDLVGTVIEVKCQDDKVATVRHGNFLRFRGSDNAA